MNKMHIAILGRHVSTINVYQHDPEVGQFRFAEQLAFGTVAELNQWIVDNQITLTATDDRQDEILGDAEVIARQYGVATWLKEGSTTRKLTDAELLEAIKQKMGVQG